MEVESDKRVGKINQVRKRALWRLFGAAIICLVSIIVIFIIGGLMAKSLAVTTKALHMLADLSSLIINFLSIALAYIKENETFSFGFHRTGNLSAY